MVEPNSISKLERRGILVVALCFLLFFVAFFAEDAARKYKTSSFNESRPGVVKFAVHYRESLPPGFNLITFLIVLALIRPRRFFVSTVLTLVYLALLIVSLYLRVDGETFLGGPIPGDPGLIEELLSNISIWDAAGALYFLIMIPWQVSLIRRASDRALDLP